MKISSNCKSTILAGTFFAVITIVSISVAHAQVNNENPILATSGPNVLEKGGKLWHNELSYEYLNNSALETTVRSISLGSIFRLGVGHSTELNFNLAAGHLQSVNASNVKSHSEMLVPAVGVKVALFEGRGVLPQIAFNTDVAFPRSIYFGEQSDVDFLRPQPTVGLEFRNRIGSRFTIDYSLGYSWHSYGYDTWDDGLRYSLAFNALLTDRLALGIAWGKGNFHALNDGGTSISNTVTTYLCNNVNATLLYQATPELQLSLQGHIQAGSAMDNWSQYSTTSSVTAGFNWKF